MLCKTCLTDKPTDGFYKGQKSKCKDCTKAAVKANFLANHLPQWDPIHSPP